MAVSDESGSFCSVAEDAEGDDDAVVEVNFPPPWNCFLRLGKRPYTLAFNESRGVE
jgi:hypothetical protein